MEFENCIIKRKWVRNWSIKISNNWEVVITVPIFSMPWYPKKIFDSKKDWIEKKLVPINNSIKRKNENKNNILYLWEYYRFIQWKSENISLETKTITSKLDITNTSIYRKWLQNKAKIYLNERCKYLWDKYKLEYNSLSIRNQKTRWWSCNIKNDISLNVNLMKCDYEIIDYVIIHELVHTQIKDHSKKYWIQVEKIYPQWKNAKKYLKSRSSELLS